MFSFNTKSWHKNNSFVGSNSLSNCATEAKKDGKITPDEIAGAAETLEDEINKLNDVIESEETKKKGGTK